MTEAEALPDKALDTIAEVETPESIRFQFRVAGPARRACAYGVDLLLRGLLAIFLLTFALITGAVGAEGLAGASSGVVLVGIFLLEWGYYVVCEALMNGTSPGKRALGLRVVRESGHPLRLSDSILRNLLRGADMLPGAYGIGLLVMCADQRFRRIGDMAAGTIVILEDRLTVSSQIRIEPPPTERELARLPARPDLSRADHEALELFVRRAQAMNPVREEELAEMVAPIYAKRMGLRYRSAARFLALLFHRSTHGGV